MAYLYLAIAIVGEVVGTAALKATKEFTRLIPSLIVVVGYGTAFFFLTLALRTIPVGIAYAVWAGIGIVLISAAAWVLYKQALDAPAIVGIALIAIGVVVINVFSTSISTRCGGCRFDGGDEWVTRAFEALHLLEPPPIGIAHQLGVPAPVEDAHVGGDRRHE